MYKGYGRCCRGVHHSKHVPFNSCNSELQRWWHPTYSVESAMASWQWTICQFIAISFIATVKNLAEMCHSGNLYMSIELALLVVLCRFDLGIGIKLLDWVSVDRMSGLKSLRKFSFGDLYILLFPGQDTKVRLSVCNTDWLNTWSE